MILTAEVDAKGLRSLVRIGGRIDKETKAIIRRTAQEARRELVASINKQGSGTIHQASAPGRPPARLTGTLVRSIRARAARSRRGDFVFVVYADPRTAFYRHFLEFGTRGLLHSQRIAPRPFIAPIQARFILILQQRLSTSIDMALKERAT